MIDLRSDTVTRPTPAMRAVMAQAEVGDDVFGEDPSILDLEARVCALFGTEEAVFTPTATMSNQIALKLHTQPLDEIICDRTSHIYNYEVGGYAFHSGCSIRYIVGDRGVFDAGQVLKNINPEDVHKPITRLVNIENTCNRGGGRIYPLSDIREIRQVCDAHALRLHMDGSRVFNALVASGISADTYGALFDTITLCFSKGLGCPAGSVLTGKRAHMTQARRIRKVMGGGMRQAGVLAAAATYALQHHIDRLRDDHAIAQVIGATLASLPYVSEMLPVETNIVIFRLADDIDDAAFIAHLAERQIHAFAIGDQWVRFVTHLDITPDMLAPIQAALRAFGA